MLPANKQMYEDPSGYRISYLDNGNDAATETLILFAPGHFTSEFFTQIEFAPLWENYRVIAPDYPGRGQSTEIDGSDDFTKIASRLECWAKSLECQNIHAIGMSFGTAVITEMLVINPSIFSRATLVAGG